MNRLLRVLLLAVLLGPPVSHALQPFADVCAEERQDCCGPNGVCDVYCVSCACCTGRTVEFASCTFGEDSVGPPARSAPALFEVPPSAPPSDILHIPESV